MPVTFSWRNNAFQFDLPPDTTLEAIRLSVAYQTRLPLDAFSLVHDGAVMANNNATISDYHVLPDSIIAIVANNTEQAQIDSIQRELSSINDTLLPAHQKFLSQLTPHSRSALAKERARLSELLLQAILHLDAITLEPDWENARRDRKVAVKQIQSLLNQLDSAWAATSVS